MKVGFSEEKITPELGTELAGYGYYLERKAEKINDELKASSIFFEGENNEKIVIVSLDVVAIDKTTKEAITKLASEKTRIPPKNFIIAATHTHSGPSTFEFNGCGKKDDAYIQKVLIPKTVSSICASHENRGEAKAGFAKTTVTDINYNRTNGHSLDQILNVLKIEGDVSAIVLNYSAHPVVFGKDSKLISRDYPGAACDFFKFLDNQQKHVLWTTGCCGDLDPAINRKRKNQTTKEDVLFMGEKIAKAALAAAKRTEVRSLQIYVAEKKIFLPYDFSFKMENIAALRQNAMNSKGFLRFIEVAEKNLEHCTSDGRETNITGIKMGEQNIIALPAEIYSSTGLKIKKKYPNTMFITTANDNVGYIAPPQEYERTESYGTGRAQLIYNPLPFTKNAEEIFLKGIEAVIEEINH